MPKIIPPRQPNKTDVMRGFIWAFAAVIAASVITVAIRGAAEYMDTRMIVLVRFWVTVLVGGLALMMFSGLRGQVRFSQPKRHILRGLFIALATHFGFYAIANVPLAAVSAIFFTAPIFAAILSIFIHGEKIGLRRASAITVGFLGVLIFLRPDTQLPPLGVLSALGSSLFYASALIMSRGLADKDGVLSTVASASVITAIFSLILVQGHFVMPTGWVIWGWLVLVTIVGVMRQFCDIQAYRFGEAAVIAPISYLRLVFIGIAGYFLFAEVPSVATVLGAVIITLSTLYVAHRENIAKHNNDE